MAGPLSWLRAHAAHVLVVGLFALPAYIAGTAPVSENRSLAALPAAPGDWQDVLALPPRMDAWINDHFGFRDWLIGTHTRLRYRLLREFPTVQMITGRHGRVFLSAHGVKQAPYSAITNVCGPGPVFDGVDVAARYFSTLVGELRALGLRPHVLIVPSAPVIEHQDLPAWLARRCATERTPVAEVLASPLITAETRAAMLYPLGQMRALKGDSALYPKTWFHWSGPALASVVDLTMPGLTGQAAPPAPALPLVTQEMVSDVSHLFNGLRLTSMVSSPDYAAAGISTCFGIASQCLPEVGAGAGEKLRDASRIRNPAAPIKRRLLILSDSFGVKVSGWYARYYQEVEQVSGNDVPRLDAQEVRQVRQYLLRAPEQTDVLVLYHDGGAIAKAIRRGLGPLHAPPGQ